MGREDRGDREIYIEAEPGDIVSRGQKDFRKPKNSASLYYLVKDDGTLTYIGDNPVTARKRQEEFHGKSESSA